MPNPKFDVFDKTLDLSGPRLIEASAGTGKTFSLVEIALRLLTEGEHPATIDRLLMVTFTNASTDELSQRLKERLEKEAVKGDGRILRALERFDDARIFTIHGFCHKMLSDCTFLHGGLYNVRLELEDAELIEQVADEFIRRGLRDATLSNADRLKLAGLKEKLQDVLKEFAAWDRPPEFRLFPDEGGPFEAYLKSFPAWGTARLKEIKRSLGVMSGDDMLAALSEKVRNNAEFAQHVRESFDAVLIDEFQDTDSVQYAAFRELFLTHPGTPASVTFVGDPKQAIYRFRRAEIETYAGARGDMPAGRVYQLGGNYRSTRALVEAFNGFFDGLCPFGTRQITYADLDCGNPKEKTPVLEEIDCDGEERPEGAPVRDRPMPVLEVLSDKQLGPAVAWDNPNGLGPDALRDMQDEWIADDIAYTLSHKCYVHGHRVEPRDICVLVSRRSYAERLIDELRRRGIRTCLPSNQDVFATGEAEDILAILKAMDAPTDLRLLAQARTTRILGDTLKNFSGDQQAVIRARTDIQETAEKFRRMGLTAAFEQLFERRAVVSRMLQLKAGRQHLRNYRHVIELLQRRAMSLPVLAGLIRWFESEKQGGKVPEERHVRIESDEDLVTFSTIHGSKGLEFPIVYLAHASRQEDVKQWEKKAAFVKFKDAGKPVIGMILDANGIPEDVRAQEIAEQEQEIARKVYVAMTRASSRLVLPLVQKRNKGLYTKVPGFGTVPKPAAWTGENPYWKVASGWNEPDPAVVPAQGKQPKKCPELLFEKTLQRIRDRIAARLPEIRADLAGRVDPGLLTPESLCRITTPVFAIDPVVPRVNVSGASSLAADPAVEVKRTWSTTSYSALRRGAPRELPDNSPDPVEEALPAERPAPADPEDIIALRGGTEIGTLLHSVLEKADFEAVPSMDEDRLKERTGQVMRHARGLFGDAYDTALAAVTRMVRDVLTAELPEGIVLATVPRDRRSPELEFDLAVGEVLPGREPLTEKTLIATLRTLCDALKESGRGDPGYTPDYLAPEQIRGFIKGFIDLFFFAQGRYWVIDWKSNWLAGTAGGYTKDAMERAMTQHGYRLQYLLYLVAVMRFLRTRLPEGADVYEQMGGALYIFIRGVRHGAPAGQGVIFDRPHRAVLECLDEVLARGYGKAVVEQFAERIRMEGSHE